jgi:hypothetical protein
MCSTLKSVQNSQLQGYLGYLLLKLNQNSIEGAHYIKKCFAINVIAL